MVSKDPVFWLPDQNRVDWKQKKPTSIAKMFYCISVQVILKKDIFYLLTSLFFSTSQLLFLRF